MKNLFSSPKTADSPPRRTAAPAAMCPQFRHSQTLLFQASWASTSRSQGSAALLLSAALALLEKEGDVLALPTSEKLERGVFVPGPERVLCRALSPQDADVRKAESRHNCLCGTIVPPRHTRNGAPNRRPS